MASVEQLLNEAHYAFHSINSGESQDNRRNASRARSLCRKIIRKFPTSTEADSAHAILKRLGDEAYSSNLRSKHRHSAEHKPLVAAASAYQSTEETVVFDWRSLLKPIFKSPTTSLLVIGIGVFILLTLFGSFFWFPLIALVLFTGPLKQFLKPVNREKANQFIKRINAYAEKNRKDGG